MLVNSKKMLKQALNRGFAIPATNFIDLDSARTFVSIADDEGLPLILSFAQSHQRFLSLEEAALIGKYLSTSVRTPITLHLDHGEDLDFIYRAIQLGFTSVMFDGSTSTLDQNIENTKQVVRFAHRHGVTVEAELGYVGANEGNYETQVALESVYTNPEEVEYFVRKTNVDSLAISIGTAHGAYDGEPLINFDRLMEIREITPVPLVLHGGSSTGDWNLKKCALKGISKINIFTDFMNSAYDSIIKSNAKNYFEIKRAVNLGMKKVLYNYYELFMTEPVDLKKG